VYDKPIRAAALRSCGTLRKTDESPGGDGVVTGARYPIRLNVLVRLTFSSTRHETGEPSRS
jgi:hypothetical protein